MKKKICRRQPKWRKYQTKVSRVFAKLGCTAETEKQITGVRAKHKVDVWVVFKSFGLENIWAIECKNWKARVPKEKVLAFKELIQDVGAHHGIIMSESGFQAGAINATKSTSISLMSLNELLALTHNAMIDAVFDRMACKIKVLSKRIFDALYPEPVHWFTNKRPGVDENGFYGMSGRLSILERSLERFRLGEKFPLFVGGKGNAAILAHSPEDLYNKANEIIEEVDSWLTTQEAAIKKAIQNGWRPQPLDDAPS